MTLLRRVLTALLVGGLIVGATFLVSPAADAAGDSYSWVGSPGPGADLFSDPANWEHGADNLPGVPGPLDFAMIDDPDEPVVITEDVTVVALVLRAPEDDQVDLRIGGYSGGSLTAQLVSLTGDSHLGDVRTHDLQLSGSFTADTDGVQLVESPAGARGIMMLDDATSPSVFGLDDGPVEIAVAGEEPSTVEGIVAPDVELHLASDAGGTFGGRVFGGDTTIVGDVPADAIVYGGADGDHTGTLTWTEPDDAVLSGLVRVSELGSGTLPDDLTVDGILDLLGPTTGGSLAIGPEGALHFTDEGPSGHGEADLVLGGSFASDATGGIWVEPADGTCVGDEDLLIRAAGGVAFPPGEMHVDASPTWFELEGVALRDELVAVARRTSGQVDDTCLPGGLERVAPRAMFRDLLGRRADTGGAAYWGRKLDGGMAAATVASRLLATDEARVHLIESTWAEWACDGEPPSDPAVAMGVEYLRGGGSLPALRADIVASTIPSDGDPVVCLYRAALGRDPDPGGRAYVEGRLEFESVQKVSRRLVMTSEGRRVRFNRLYQHLLGRDAQPVEVADSVAAIQSGRTEQWVTAQIAGTNEYLERSSV